MKRCTWVPAGGPTCEKPAVVVAQRAGSPSMPVCLKHFAAYLAAADKPRKAARRA